MIYWYTSPMSVSWLQEQRHHQDYVASDSQHFLSPWLVHCTCHYVIKAATSKSKWYWSLGTKLWLNCKHSLNLNQTSVVWPKRGTYAYWCIFVGNSPTQLVWERDVSDRKSLYSCPHTTLRNCDPRHVAHNFKMLRQF